MHIILLVVLAISSHIPHSHTTSLLTGVLKGLLDPTRCELLVAKNLVLCQIHNVSGVAAITMAVGVGLNSLGREINASAAHGTHLCLQKLIQ